MVLGLYTWVQPAQLAPGLAHQPHHDQGPLPATRPGGGTRSTTAADYFDTVQRGELLSRLTLTSTTSPTPAAVPVPALTAIFTVVGVLGMMFSISCGGTKT